MTVDSYGSKSARIVAVGDIHGDFDALVRILLGSGIVDEQGSWVAGPTRLVFMGDLNDRGPESVPVMSFVMELEASAPSSGGSVTALLGNHELLAVQGIHGHVNPVEVLATEHYWHGERQGLGAIYRGDSRWARWIRSRRSSLVLDGVLFLHAGLGPWAHRVTAAEVDAGVRSWIAYFQGAGSEPEVGTEWLVTQTGDGPLWTDRFAVDSPLRTTDGMDSFDLETALAAWGAVRVVVGHKRTRSFGYHIVAAHPAEGDRVVSIDTGISRACGGRLSALEIQDGQMFPRYFDRGDGPAPLMNRLRERYRLSRD